MPESPEAVAWQLLNMIAEAEEWRGRGAVPTQTRWQKTRAEILEAFAECLRAAKGNRPARPASAPSP